MKQIVTINEKQITIRGMKFKEIKEFTGLGREKIEAVFSLLDDADLFLGIEKFILENLADFGVLLLRFTDLKMEEVDELDLQELMQLMKELLHVNGISPKKVMDFFMSVSGAVKETAGKMPEMSFTEEVPATL